MKGLLFALLVCCSAIECNTLEFRDTQIVEPMLLAYEQTIAEPRVTEPIKDFDYREVNLLSKLVYGEARSCNLEGKAGVIWCVLNRVDDEGTLFPDTITEVITQQNQFFGYREDSPVLPEIQELVVDVLQRWAAEHSGVKDVGRVLPREYLYFSGDGKNNYFTTEYNDFEIWDWSLKSPYTE